MIDAAAAGWTLGGLALLVLAVAYYGAIHIVAIPPLAIPNTPDDFGLTYETWVFPARDGLKLTGWFIPAAAPSGRTILIIHGLGSNAGDMLQTTESLLRVREWNVFLFDLRGHGASEGTRTSLGPLELEDSDAALETLRERKPEACGQIALFGHSLGGAVAIALAARHPEIRGLIVESAFAETAGTVRHFARRFYGLPYFPFVVIALWIGSRLVGRSLRRFRPVDEIGRISPRPVLLIHAERDGRTPQSDADALWRAAQEPKERWDVPGADHGEPWFVQKAEYDRRLTEFYRKVFQ